MRYKRWTFGFSIVFDRDKCRCGYDRDDGRHLPVRECYGGPDGICPDESAHHPFRRRLVPVRAAREFVW